MPSFARIRTIVIAAVACLAFLPVKAQLDPRLQSGITDLLEVYQSKPAKPELLTLYDFSGSMHAVYWNSKYYTNAAQNLHNAKWDNLGTDIYGGTISPNGDFPGLVPVFDSNGYIWMVPGTGYYSSIYNKFQPSQFQLDGSGHPTAQLVAPDGTLIALNHSRSYKYSDLNPYVLQASHIRVTATYGGVTRTVDLPIPWAILDSTNTSTNNASAELVQLTDPSGGPSVYPDTLFQHQTNGTSYVVNNADSSFGLLKIGRFHYNMDYLWWVFFGQDVRNSTGDGTVATGSYVVPDATSAPTWKNGLSGMTRFQALKFATLSAWFTNQNKVWWGARFLDGSEENKNTVSANNGNASSVQVTRDINLFRPAANSSTANSSVTQFADMIPNTSTPLTYAFANAYAQLAYTSDASSSFGTSSGGGQSGTEKPIPTCRHSFLVAFTDGIANDTYSRSGDAIGDWDPYQVDSMGKPTLNPALGNAAVDSYRLSALAPSYASSHSGHSLFNIWTLAGVAAHYAKPAAVLPSSGTTGYLVQDIAPFGITSRGASLTGPRQIRTMTVGMSLAGSLADGASGKSDLYRAALYGNHDSKGWIMGTPPYDPTPGSPNQDASVNPFFFDATDVNKLSQAMTAILAEVTSASGSIAAPSSPLVGLSLGNEVYLGLFQTSQSTRWQGDLLMAGFLPTSQGTYFVDKSKNVTTTVTGDNAIWSVSTDVFQLKERTWKTRNIFTNFNTSINSSNTTTLVKLDTATITNPAAVGAPDAATANAYIRFMRGASAAAQVDPSPSPSDDTPRTDIMGDIINSSPVVLEYPVSALTSTISPTLASQLGSRPTDGSAGPAHFRVIFVGDNQGIFHAFGEVSWTTSQVVTKTTIDNSTTPPTTTTQTYNADFPTAFVDELWAFVPGEYLKYISQLMVKSNPHRYTVDGTPTIYFNDANGNGLVDPGETVRVIVGERKGGRSYYAFDFSNLANAVAPSGGTSSLAWKLVPDDITTTDVQSLVLQRLGFSSGNPAIARVDTNTGTKDLLFIGGGLSVSAIESNFTAAYGAGTKLGRSLIAFDVVNGPGSSLYTWNFADPAFTTKFGPMGCIAGATVPFALDPTKPRTWRVYFSDTPSDSNVNTTTPRGGGVWALGQTALFTTADGTTTPNIIRKDSSNIDVWTGGARINTTQGIRHIFQAPTGYSLTTAPACFLIAKPSVYPVARTLAPQAQVQAVAITFGTGDRNDPLDEDLLNPVVVGTANNYMNVIFDRNDSGSLSGVTSVHSTNVDVDGILESTDVADLTDVNSFTDPRLMPGTSTYYLATDLGYKLRMGNPTPQAVAGYFYYPKVITAAVVNNGVLFFSDFLPGQGNTGSCTGTGITNTYRVNNVLSPTFHGGTASNSPGTFNGGDPNNSGIVLTFPNLPGELTAVGNNVVQSGQGATIPGGTATINNSGATLQNGQGNPNGRLFRPRAWRVVR